LILSPGYSLLIIFIIAIITFALRAAPFILFNKNGGATPRSITYLGNALPPAVMGMLIVYSLRNVSVTAFPFGLPEALAILVVGLLHIWKKNSMISILGGTVLYMVLIQVVFA
jgi:branched-subunit amino acid transport protein AzlD